MLAKDLVVKKSENKKRYYRIGRNGTGYSVFSADGKPVTPENVWPITMKLLERLLKAEVADEK